MHRPRLLLGATALLALVSLLPIWSVRFLPPCDHVKHMAAVTIWHYIDDPAFDFSRYYALELGVAPYWGFYFVTHLLAYLGGVDLAGRLVLSLYVLGLPAGMALLARRFGRAPELGLVAFPLLWNDNFFTGFSPFCFGMVLLPFALVAFDRVCERPTTGRAALAVVLGGLTFFMHLLVWTTYLACAGMVGLAHEGRSPRRIAARAAVWALTLGVGLAGIARGRGLYMDTVGRGSWAFAYRPFLDVVKSFFPQVWNGCLGQEDLALAALGGLGLFPLLLSGKRRPLRAHHLRAEACVLVCVVAFLVLPRSVLRPTYWWGINIRFPTMALLFAGISVVGPLAGWRRWCLLPIVLSGLGLALDTTRHFHAANRFGETPEFETLARVPEVGSRVYVTVGGPRHDEGIRYHFMDNYSSNYQTLRGGYSPWNFDVGFPLSYKVRYPAPGWRALDFSWQKHARYYDYVLGFRMSDRPFGNHPAKQVATAGHWALWRLPGPRDDQPPGPAYPPDWATDPLWPYARPRPRVTVTSPLRIEGPDATAPRPPLR